MASATLQPLNDIFAPRVRRSDTVRFHVAPNSGWINDPNGPLLYANKHHLFYQHVPNSSEWAWGLTWGHATSADLVRWRHHPIALAPSPHTPDMDGCFSGCAAVDSDGRPTILYTGVVRKPAELVEPGHAQQHETQMMAVAADPGDPELTEWIKLPGAFLPEPGSASDLLPPHPDHPHAAALATPTPSSSTTAPRTSSRRPHIRSRPPPTSGGVIGWRDPFVLSHPTTEDPHWVVMVGAGAVGIGALAAVYKSRGPSLRSGWDYVGPLAASPDSHMWECPLLAHLPLVNTAGSTVNASSSPHSVSSGASTSSNSSAVPLWEGRRHLLCVSPDFCLNVSTYWLGRYEPRTATFDLGAAAGPYKLDLGDILYAPNLMTDKQGRVVYWAWMQEGGATPRPPGRHTSACCLSVPRLLALDAASGQLHTSPLPELAELRSSALSWSLSAARGSSKQGAGAGAGAGVLHQGSSMVVGAELGPASAGGVTPSGDVGVTLVPGQPLEVGWDDCAACGQLDWELTLLRGASSACAVVLPPQVIGGGRGGALVFDWESRQLQLVHSTDWDVLEEVAGTPLPPVPHKLLLDQVDQSTDSREQAALTGVDLGLDQPQQPVLPVEQLTVAAAEGTSAVSASTNCCSNNSINSNTAGSSSSTSSSGGGGWQQHEASLPKRCGGVLRAAGGLCPTLPPSQQRLSLRLLLDSSLVEVFTAEGEALGGRVYRSAPPDTVLLPPTAAGGSLYASPDTLPPPAAAAVSPQAATTTTTSTSAKVGGYWVGSFGGSAQLTTCSMWHMDSCWEEGPQELLQQLAVPAPAAGVPTAAAAAAGGGGAQEELLPVEALLAVGMEATATAVGAAAVVGASAAVAAAGGLLTPLVALPVTGASPGDSVAVGGGGGSGRASPLVSPRQVTTPVEGGH